MQGTANSPRNISTDCYLLTQARELLPPGAQLPKPCESLSPLAKCLIDACNEPVPEHIGLLARAISYKLLGSNACIESPELLYHIFETFLAHNQIGPALRFAHLLPGESQREFTRYAVLRLAQEERYRTIKYFNDVCNLGHTCEFDLVDQIVQQNDMLIAEEILKDIYGTSYPLLKLQVCCFVSYINENGSDVGYPKEVTDKMLGLLNYYSLFVFIAIEKDDQALFDAYLPLIPGYYNGGLRLTTRIDVSEALLSDAMFEDTQKLQRRLNYFKNLITRKYEALQSSNSEYAINSEFQSLLVRAFLRAERNIKNIPYSNIELVYSLLDKESQKKYAANFVRVAALKGDTEYVLNYLRKEDWGVDELVCILFSLGFGGHIRFATESIIKRSGLSSEEDIKLYSGLVDGLADGGHFEEALEYIKLNLCESWVLEHVAGSARKHKRVDVIEKLIKLCPEDSEKELERMRYELAIAAVRQGNFSLAIDQIPELTMPYQWKVYRAIATKCIRAGFQQRSIELMQIGRHYSGLAQTTKFICERIIVI